MRVFYRLPAIGQDAWTEYEVERFGEYATTRIGLLDFDQEVEDRIASLSLPAAPKPTDYSSNELRDQAGPAPQADPFAAMVDEKIAPFLPVEDGPDPNTISTPTPKSQSLAEFMAQHEEPRGPDISTPTYGEPESQGDAPAPRGPIGGAVIGALEGVGNQLGRVATSAKRLFTTDAIPKALEGAGRYMAEGMAADGGDATGMSGLGIRTTMAPAAQARKMGMAPDLTEGVDVGRMAETAGDVANVIPGWQAANFGFSALRDAAIGAGLPETLDIGGVPVPVADITAAALQMGGPGALRAGQKALAPGLDAALASAPRYGAQTAERIAGRVGSQVDEAGGLVPFLERGQADIPPSTVKGLGKAVERLAGDEIPDLAAPIVKTAEEEVERLRLDKFPEDLRPLIQDAAERMNFATGQRRGVISDEAAESMADDLGRTTEQWLRGGKAGRAYNTEELRALANGITTQAARVRELGLEVAKPGADNTQAIAQMMIEGDKLAALTALREGAKAEAGRALRAFRQEARMAADPNDAISRIFAKVGGADNAREMASKYAAMVEEGADPIQMAKFWAKVEAPPAGFSDWFTALRYNSMLSGPRTFAVNLIGNTLEVPWRLGRDTLASGARAIGTRSVEPLREVGSEAAGLYAGAQKGVKSFMEVLKHGLTEEQALAGDLPRSLSSRLDPQQAGRFPGLVRAAQPAADTLESVGRLLSGADEFARQAAYGMAKGRLAAREATRKNLTGKAWEAEYERVMGDFVPRLERQAMQEANRMTYKGDMGGVGSLLSRAQTSDKQAVRIGSNLILPFLRTVYHISARGVDRSPLGIIGTGIDVARGKYGGVRQLGKALGGEMLPNAEKGLVPLGERVGDNAIGGMMTLWFGQQAIEGNISGAGPDNTQERDVLKAQGWQPYSIRLGDKWVSYSNWGPVAIPLAMAAGAGEAVTYKKPGAPGADMFVDAAGRFAKLAADQPYLQGIGAIYKASQEPERFGQTWLTSTLSSLIPFGAAINTVGQAFDPLERQADPGDIGGAVAKRIPGLRENLPVARTALGDEQPNPFAGLSAINPLRVNAAANPATAKVRKYLGSKSAAEDYQISQALSRVQKWENNPGEYKRPTPEEIRLARRFEDRENPRYQELIRNAAARERRERLARQAK